MKNVHQTGLIAKAQKTLHIEFVNTMSLSLGLAAFTANTDYTEDYSHFVCHNKKHKILCKPLYTDLRFIPTFTFFLLLSKPCSNVTMRFTLGTLITTYDRKYKNWSRRRKLRPYFRTVISARRFAAINKFIPISLQVPLTLLPE